jgi:hypothetical protein
MTGMNMDKVVEKTNSDLKSFEITREMSEKIYVIPPHTVTYLRLLKVTVITMKRL